MVNTSKHGLGFRVCWILGLLFRESLGLSFKVRGCWVGDLGFTVCWVWALGLGVC